MPAGQKRMKITSSFPHVDQISAAGTRARKTYGHADRYSRVWLAAVEWFECIRFIVFSFDLNEEEINDRIRIASEFLRT